MSISSNFTFHIFFNVTLVLGRLKFSRYDGKDSSGKYHALYTIGGRSFSIWDVTSGLGKDTSALPRLFDSGSQIEELTALHCPHLFNRDEDVVDGRSDNMVTAQINC